MASRFAEETNTTLHLQTPMSFMYSNQNGYIKCRRIHNQQYEETSTYLHSDNLPAQAKPVELETMPNNHWQIRHVTHVLDVSPQPRNWANESFEQYLESVDIWEYDLLWHSKIFADPFSNNWEHEEGFHAGCDESKNMALTGHSDG